MGVIPHVAQNTSGRRLAVPNAIAVTPGYAMSMQKRKLIEQGFGWAKTVGRMRQVRQSVYHPQIAAFHGRNGKRTQPVQKLWGISWGIYIFPMRKFPYENQPTFDSHRPLQTFLHRFAALPTLARHRSPSGFLRRMPNEAGMNSLRHSS